jgi:hypothetical protein
VLPPSYFKGTHLNSLVTHNRYKHTHNNNTKHLQTLRSSPRLYRVLMKNRKTKSKRVSIQPLMYVCMYACMYVILKYEYIPDEQGEEGREEKIEEGSMYVSIDQCIYLCIYVCIIDWLNKLNWLTSSELKSFIPKLEEARSGAEALSDKAAERVRECVVWFAGGADAVAWVILRLRGHVCRMHVFATSAVWDLSSVPYAGTLCLSPCLSSFKVHATQRLLPHITHSFCMST